MAFKGGDFERCSWRQRKRPFGWKHPKADLSWRESIFGLEEEKGDLKRKNGFHLHSSPLFLLSLIFYCFIPPIHVLISFYRVLM